MSFVHNHHRRSERKRVSDVKIDIDAVDDVETFLVPEEFLLADYDPKIVAKASGIDHLQLNFQKYIGAVFKMRAYVYVGMFLVLYIIFWCITRFLIMADQDHDCQEESNNNCSSPYFCQAVDGYREDYNTALGVLTFLIGFYLSVVIGRWWTQITLLPEVEDIAIQLNAMTLPGPDSQELKKTILRHCLLSMSMLYIAISSSMRESIHSPEDLIRKGLSASEQTDKWLRVGSRKNVDKDIAAQCFREKWWKPLVWCSHIIHENETAFTSSKRVAKSIVRLKEGLSELGEYSFTPLPALAEKGVRVVYWFTMVYGAFVLQECSVDDWQWQTFALAGGRFLIQAAKLAILYVWIKMADECSNPFDGNSLFDVNLFEQLERNIWAASASLDHDNNKSQNFKSLNFYDPKDA